MGIDQSWFVVVMSYARYRYITINKFLTSTFAWQPGQYVCCLMHDTGAMYDVQAEYHETRFPSSQKS